MRARYCEDSRVPQLSVATYNIYLGAQVELLFGAGSTDELGSIAARVQDQLTATDFVDRAEALARVLAREHPDVVGLQEVTRWSSAPLSDPEQAEVVVDFLPVLLDALDAAGCAYDAHAVDRNFEGGLPVADRWLGVSGANVLLVRRGGALTVTAERAASYRRTAEIATPLDGVSFPIRRGYGLLEGTVAGRPVLVLNTHLEAYDAEVRDAQREEMLAAVAAGDRPVVVLGDFNAAPGRVGMPGAFLDAWLAAGGDPAGGLTCGQAGGLDNAASTLRQRIDYVFVRDARVTACTVVGDRERDRSRRARLWPSDHAGVVARLQF
jgi:endonuclease/exonuclease/phosphatase family metal-dependent hydrolase